MSKIGIIAALTMSIALAVPSLALAQDHRHSSPREVRRDRREIRHDVRELHRDRHDLQDKRRDDHRQNTKNAWRNLGIAGGAVGVVGLLSGNKTLAALGLGGGLYSTYRYEQDRKSQNRDARYRYQLFSRPAFDDQGHRYTRRVVTRNGERYYSFDRGR